MTRWSLGSESADEIACFQKITERDVKESFPKSERREESRNGDASILILKSSLCQIVLLPSF
jgi:hypothetical protein